MSSNDPYSELIDGQWHNIVMMYEAFKDKKPIIEYDVIHDRVYSYPANEYIESLSQRTREQTKQQYKEAVRKNQFLLFVKDFKDQIFRSYIFSLPTQN